MDSYTSCCRQSSPATWSNEKYYFLFGVSTITVLDSVGDTVTHVGCPGSPSSTVGGFRRMVTSMASYVSVLEFVTGSIWEFVYK